MLFSRFLGKGHRAPLGRIAASFPYSGMLNGNNRRILWFKMDCRQNPLSERKTLFGIVINNKGYALANSMSYSDALSGTLASL
ncbi:MAG: hypothetical protein J5812_05540, partial [Candidatus Methanomethylophilaceae archaeon]|nr:hypothetical protein [Candidatus Methanomethylophilaceae archaeon]